MNFKISKQNQKSKIVVFILLAIFTQQALSLRLLQSNDTCGKYTITNNGDCGSGIYCKNSAPFCSKWSSCRPEIEYDSSANQAHNYNRIPEECGGPANGGPNPDDNTDDNDDDNTDDNTDDNDDVDCDKFIIESIGACGPINKTFCSERLPFCDEWNWCQTAVTADRKNTDWDYDHFPEECKGSGPGPKPDNSIPADVQRAMESGTMINHNVEVDFTNIENNVENVQRAMRTISKAFFEENLPRKNEVYTWEGFMQAIARYPKFCGEKADTVTMTLDQMCKREIGILIAHATQETGENDVWSSIPDWKQGLYWVTEMGCDKGDDVQTPCSGYSQSCEWPLHGKWFPCPAEGRTHGYYGRGAIQLSYSYNYGSFGLSYAADQQIFLDKPERIAKEGELALLATLWFYMTPQNPKPSMHEVVVELFIPGERDINDGITVGFGATTNIINGGIECNTQGDEFIKSDKRIKYFKNWMGILGVSESEDHFMTENLGCSHMGQFMENGAAGERKLYWEQQGNGCMLVKWASKYVATIEGAYEMCQNNQ